MRWLAAVVCLALCAAAQAQSRHDPLNEREIDAMRENAQEPKKRIELMIGFARERVLAIERLRSSTQPDAARIGDLLGELAALIDELDDNLEMYHQHSEDLRRPLRHVLDAEEEFLQKLDALGSAATPGQRSAYATPLVDATESIRSSHESAQAMLNNQIAKKGEEKSKDKTRLDKQEANDAKHPRKDGDDPPPDYTGTGGVGQQPPER